MQRWTPELFRVEVDGYIDFNSCYCHGCILIRGWPWFGSSNHDNLFSQGVLGGITVGEGFIKTIQ